MPLLSIVTVNLDDRAGLEKTLGSVARQTFRDRESIVIDGGSTDGSVEVVRAHAGLVTDWVSEKDRGVYDAMNKGIARARGTYVLFMNAGDTFVADDALERFVAAGPLVEDVVYGDVIYEGPGKRDLWESPDKPDLDFFWQWCLPHQSVAIRRDLFDRVGLHDTRFRVCGDLEFFLRAIVVRGATTRHVRLPLAVQALGGLSSSPEGFARLREERKLAKEVALPPEQIAAYEARLAAKRGLLHHTVRTAFRPLARKLRGISRRLRNKPDSAV